MSDITISQPVPVTEKPAAITTAAEGVKDKTKVEVTSLTTPGEENTTLGNRRKNKGKGKKPNAQKSTTTGEKT